MRKVKVLPGQTLLDVVLQEKGSLQGLNDILKANNLNAGDEVVPGTEITITGEPSDREAYRYITRNNIKPATSIDEFESKDVQPTLGGIGYWIIEQDFIVK
jgi:hypothetical protein